MGFPKRLLWAVLLAPGIMAAQGSQAAEPKTWYVYCEGNSPNGHWAVFSENFWPHPDSAEYGRRVGSAAEAFFEARHDLALEGCSGVNFRDDSLAEHSRKLTVQLHRKMGDRVYFFPLPPEVLPADGSPTPVIATAATSATEPVESGRAAQPSGQPDAERHWRPRAPSR